MHAHGDRSVVVLEGVALQRDGAPAVVPALLLGLLVPEVLAPDLMNDIIVMMKLMMGWDGVGLDGDDIIVLKKLMIDGMEWG